MRSLFSLGAAQAVRGLCRARRNEGEGCRSMDDNRMGRPFFSRTTIPSSGNVACLVPCGEDCSVSRRRDGLTRHETKRPTSFVDVDMTSEWPCPGESRDLVIDTFLKPPKQ
jgi:hypothetical protein